MTLQIQILRHGALLATGVTSGLYIYIKSQNFEKGKEAQELKIGNKLVPVPESINHLLLEAQSDVKSLIPKTSKFTLFMSKCFDFTSFGCLDTAKGLHIGLPKYFLADKDSGVDLTTLMNGKERLISPNELQALKESLCLSKEAKKFGLAVEMVESLYALVFPYGILPVLSAVNFIVMSKLMEVIYRKRSRKVKLPDHVFLLLLLASFYFLFCRLYFIMAENRCNKDVSELGNSYVKGGVEYYEKMIARNEILGKLQEIVPPTKEGDGSTYSFKKISYPIEKRLTHLKELEEGKESKGWFSSALSYFS